MRYMVTGYTSGIGAEIMRQLGHVAHGFSRSNGFDIQNPSVIHALTRAFEDYDVFINNACPDHSNAQTELLDSLAQTYLDDKKYIVNVGSAVTEYDLSKFSEGLLRYQYNKNQLLTRCFQLNQVEMQLKCQYVSFGYVGTERILNKYPDLTDYITPEHAAQFIIETPQHGMAMNRIEPNEPFQETRTPDIPLPPDISNPDSPLG